jgi:mannosyltransferase OCH1-like enzyme
MIYFNAVLASLVFVSGAENGVEIKSRETSVESIERIPGEEFYSTSFWHSMQWKREDSSLEFRQDQDVKLVEQNFIRFCQNKKDSLVLNYEHPPSTFSIPPILHFIWIGSPLTLEAKRAVESWEKHHQGWEIRVWTDEEVKNFSWTEDRLQQSFNDASTWAEKADILRLDILYQFGGIYSDMDVNCLQPFHDLIVQNITFFSCFELNYASRHYGASFYVGTAVMGASKGSPLMKYCLNHLKTQQEAPSEGILKRTGPGLVSRACQAALLDHTDHILILPCSYLYPFPWKSRSQNS